MTVCDCLCVYCMLVTEGKCVSVCMCLHDAEGSLSGLEPRLDSPVVNLPHGL